MKCNIKTYLVSEIQNVVSYVLNCTGKQSEYLKCSTLVAYTVINQYSVYVWTHGDFRSMFSIIPIAFDELRFLGFFIKETKFRVPTITY